MQLPGWNKDTLIVLLMFVGVIVSLTVGIVGWVYVLTPHGCNCP